MPNGEKELPGGENDEGIPGSYYEKVYYGRARCVFFADFNGQKRTDGGKNVRSALSFIPVTGG